MLNRVTLIGNLGQDPEIKILENGVKVARLSIATNKGYKGKDGNWQNITEWHRVILWRFLADRAESQSKKGNLVYIEGELTTRKYEKEDGTTQYFTEVVGNKFRLLEKRENNGGMPSLSDAPPSSNNSDIPNLDNVSTTEGSSDEDLPF